MQAFMHQEKHRCSSVAERLAHLRGVRGVLLAPLVVPHLAMAASACAASRSRVRHWRCPLERGSQGACCRWPALEGPVHAHSRGMLSCGVCRMLQQGPKILMTWFANLCRCTLVLVLI